MLTTWLVRYGYAMVFASAAIEGDAALLTSTYLAHRGYLRLWPVMIVAAIATVTVNQVYFWMGRRYGRRRLELMAGHPRYGRVLRWIRRFGLELVVGSRFVYGCRIAIPAACGATRMSPLMFTLGDLVGATVWTGVLGFGGYAIGHLLALAIDDLRRHEWVVAGVLLLLALAIVGRWHDRAAFTRYSGPGSRRSKRDRRRDQ